MIWTKSTSKDSVKHLMEAWKGLMFDKIEGGKKKKCAEHPKDITEGG